MRAQQSTSLCDLKYKIVFLGDMGVGKTSIIQRFVRDEFDINNNPTVGIDFLSRNLTIKSHTYRLQLWDTAGQQKYKSLVPAYLRDANCAVFVFDVNRKQSIENLKSWIQLYHDNRGQNSLGIVVGNKIDNIQNKKLNEQSRQIGACLAERQNMSYEQASAKTGHNVMQIFHKIINLLQQESNPSSAKKAENEEELEAENICLQLDEIEKRRDCCSI